MSEQDRRRWRRRGRWFIDHWMRLFGEFFYSLANDDWEADQKWIAKYRAEQRKRGIYW